MNTRQGCHRLGRSVYSAAAMTEIPEHLLRRSRERREALGLGGGEGGGEAAPAPAAAAPAASAAPAEGAEVEAAPAPEPVVVEVVPPRPAPPPTRVPVWVLPVLAVLPLWAFFYLGAFGERAASGTAGPSGAQVFSSSCASCHGARGEGGVGPALADGAVKLTFPNVEDHLKWVNEGSTGSGAPYGDPARPGGQRRSQGGMPPFADTLSEAEIRAVVEYEREGL